MHLLKQFLLLSIPLTFFFLSNNLVSAVPEPVNDGSLLDRMIESDKAKTQMEEDEKDQSDMKKADFQGLKEESPEESNEDGQDEDEEEKPKMNFETGQALTNKKAQETSLVTAVMPRDDSQMHLMYHAFIERSTDPIMLRFKPSSTCTPGGKNLLRFNIDICPMSEEECPNGMAICYPGKLDPINKNVPGFSESLFALKNNKESEAFKMCNKNKPESWDVWGNSELHGILIKSETIEGKTQVNIMSSFTDGLLMDELDPKECIKFKIGTESGALGEMVVEKGDYTVVIGDPAHIAKRYLANGLSFDQFMPNVVPIDMMMGYDANMPVFALVGSQDCQMKLKIYGERLEPCLDNKKCRKPKPARLRRKALGYRMYFATKNMVPIQSDYVPSHYRGSVVLEFEEGTMRPQGFLSGKGGTEVIFGILTETPEPPEFYLFYPRTAGCTIQGDYKSNMFVLAYNGRPDCYMRLAWGERRIYMVDKMDKANYIASINDVQVSFRGINRDQLWGVDRNGEDKSLGRGTCGIQGEYLGKKKFAAVDELPYLWRFIINPKKGGDGIPRTNAAHCDLGVMVYFDEYIITLVKDNPDLNEDWNDDDVDE